MASAHWKKLDQMLNVTYSFWLLYVALGLTERKQLVASGSYPRVVRAVDLWCTQWFGAH